MTKLEKAAAIVTVIGFPVLVISMFFAFYQIRDLEKVAASQNNIALNAMFFNDPNTGIIDAIENGRPILREHKGGFTDAQLDNYLGDFDTISDAYDEGLLTDSDLCDSFSYYINATASSSEVQQFMVAEGPSFYSGLPELARIVAANSNTNCRQ